MFQKESKIKIKVLLKYYNEHKLYLYFKGYNDKKIYRNDVWNIQQKSNFINSIFEDMIIPPMCFNYTYENKKKKFYIIDGIQRMTTIVDYVNNKFKPIGRGINKNICNRLYEDLPLSYKMKFVNNKLSVINQQGTIKENLNTFVLYNNGTNKEAIELFNAKLGKNYNILLNISQNKLFSISNINDKNNIHNMELALYFLMLESNSSIGLNKNQKEAFIEKLQYNKTIKKEIIRNIQFKLNYLFRTFYRKEYLDIHKDTDKYLKKSHLLILYRIVDDAIKLKISEDNFFAWANNFFYINKNDNNLYWIESSRGSTTSKSSMDIRYKYLYEDFNNYFKINSKRIIYIAK